jgi:hypothetical protein
MDELLPLRNQFVNVVDWVDAFNGWIYPIA